MGASALAQAADAEPPPPGATVEEMLTLARQVNPEVQAGALEAEASAARARGTGYLPDPTLTLLSDENMVESGQLLPSRSGNLTVTLQQAIPLGGRLGLMRDAATAEARASDQRRQAMARDVEARVKVGFAEHYQAVRSLAMLREVRDLLQGLSQLAESRYPQGLSSQQEVLGMRAELSMLDTELQRMEAERNGARFRLNALLNRPGSAPLADPKELRPLPAESALELAALVERARESNPELAAQGAQVESAESNRILADRSWYPDLMLGFGVMTARDGTRAYEAMVGVNLPIRWAWREAQVQEATAMVGTIRSRLEAKRLETEAELGMAVATLQGERQAARILTERTIPENLVAVQSVKHGYELGRVEFLSVLEASRRLRQSQLELLRVEVEAQRRLADIERLIGGEL